MIGKGITMAVEGDEIHRAAMNKVPLTKSLLTYAFWDQYQFADPNKVRERKRDLKKKLRETGSIITGRKLKRAVEEFSAETQNELRGFLSRRSSLRYVYIDIVLLLTLPSVHTVLKDYCSDAKSVYSTKEIADIVGEDVAMVSKAFDDFIKKSKTGELFRWSNFSVHLYRRKIAKTAKFEYWASLDEDTEYRSQRVEYVIFYIPNNVASLEDALKHPAMKSLKDLCEMWNPKTFAIESKSDSVIEVVIVRQNAVAHSRFYADGKLGEDIALIFTDRTLASNSISC